MFARYKAQYPDLADNIERMNKRELPADWEKALPTFPPSASGMSTRDASGKVLNALAQKIPWLLGGAADLYPSTKTRLEFEFAGDFQAKAIWATTRAATSTSAFASTPCAPSSTAWC